MVVGVERLESPRDGSLDVELPGQRLVMNDRLCYGAVQANKPESHEQGFRDRGIYSPHQKDHYHKLIFVRPVENLLGCRCGVRTPCVQRSHLCERVFATTQERVRKSGTS